MKQISQRELENDLRALFDANKQKRVCVVGTTCTGKSTLLKLFPEAVDMDEIVFPKLSKQESDYVDSKPWTPEIGKKMIELARKHAHVEPGKPVFGTVVLDCDLIVELKISDELLRERVAARSLVFEDAKNMQAQIEREFRASGVESVVLKLG